jgi:hypothetical protein
MAPTDVNIPAPSPNSADSLGPDDVRLIYNREDDVLIVSLIGDPRPAISRPVNDYAVLRVDPVTGEMYGVEIERFLSKAIFAEPEFVMLLPVLPLSQKDRARVYQRLAKIAPPASPQGSAKERERRAVESLIPLVKRTAPALAT